MIFEKLFEIEKLFDELKKWSYLVSKSRNINIPASNNLNKKVKISGKWVTIYLSPDKRIEEAREEFDSVEIKGYILRLLRDNRVVSDIFLNFLSPLNLFELYRNRETFLKILKEIDKTLFDFFSRLIELWSRSNS